MESTGIPSYIQVSEVIYEALKDSYPFYSRGAQKVKGKKEPIYTYLLSLSDLRKQMQIEDILSSNHEMEETVTLSLNDFQ